MTINCALRLLLVASALVLGTQVAVAQKEEPANLEPLPEPPPPPEAYEPNPELEPQVTIIQRGEDTVTEYRVGGKLYMVRVTPPHGKSYYMIDERGDGILKRQESFDTGLRVPMWVIHSFD